ncbi:MAG: phage tail protein [Gammaproteobacteria bacterium]|nr:phage tail protein [Gammaproteobacteria bacterium]MBU1859338.1 phage tail protein [Gammaproteobacteria bacterium]
MEKVGAYTERATEIGEWRPGNPGLGQQATPMLAAYFNMLQRELVGVVEKAGLELDPEDDGQLLRAIRGGITTLAADTALTASHAGLLLLDASGGNRLITLPASNAALGVIDVIVRRTDNTGNRLKVQADGADKIKFHTHLSAAGYGFLYLMGAGDWWHLRSDGQGNWWPIARRDDSPLGRLSFETSTAIQPGGYGLPHGVLFVRADWPWVWDHAQASGMLVNDASRVGFEGCWTRGDGATTVRSPDVRAEFLRSLDEGRGIDLNRIAGSSQKATFVAVGSGPAADGITTFSDLAGAAGRAALGLDTASLSEYVGAKCSNPGNSSTPVFAATDVDMTYGTVRPRNITYPARIKLI